MLFEAIAQLNQKYHKMPTGKTKKQAKPSYKRKQFKKQNDDTQQRKFASSNTRRRRQDIKNLIPGDNGGY